jgi:hypothetical protein
VLGLLIVRNSPPARGPTLRAESASLPFLWVSGRASAHISYFCGCRDAVLSLSITISLRRFRPAAARLACELAWLSTGSDDCARGFRGLYTAVTGPRAYAVRWSRRCPVRTSSLDRLWTADQQCDPRAGQAGDGARRSTSRSRRCLRSVRDFARKEWPLRGSPADVGRRGERPSQGNTTWRSGVADRAQQSGELLRRPHPLAPAAGTRSLRWPAT